jgi:hypothetical protein
VGARCSIPLGLTQHLAHSFPGWAAIKDGPKGKEVVVEVSGYAYRTRPLEKASRSQRLFVAAAKQLAGLAKVPEKIAQAIDEQLPPAGLDAKVAVDGAGDTKRDAFTQILALGADAKELDDAELEEELMTEEPEALRGPVAPPLPPRPGEPPKLPPRSVAPSVSRSSSISSTSTADLDPNSDISRMHINLRDRLRAFFAQKLEGRHVRVSVHRAGEAGEGGQPLARGTLLTAEGGGFTTRFAFPRIESIAIGDTLRVVAELLPDPDADAPTVEGPHFREDECFVAVSRPGVPRVVRIWVSRLALRANLRGA